MRLIRVAALALLAGFLLAPRATAAPRGRERDRDRQPDVSDPCPSTPRGAPQVFPGCAALDLLEGPEVLLGPLAAQARDMASAWSLQRELVPLADALDRASLDVARAVGVLRAGDPCSGERTLGEALAGLDHADALFPDVLRAAQAAIPRDPSLEDESAEEEWFHVLGTRRDDLRALRGEAGSVADAYARVCAAAVPGVSIRGRVLRVRDDLGRIELEDGRLLGAADPLVRRGFADQGVEVEASGIQVSPGHVLVTEIEGEATLPMIPIPAPCLQLRFVPVQPAPEDASQSWIQHFPLAYHTGSVHELEVGMAFAVADGGCETKPKRPPFPRYSMEIDLLYDDGSGTKTRPLAAALRPESDPVPIGSWLEPTWTNLTLETRTFRRSCFQKGLQLNCGAATLIEENSYPLAVRARGAYCGVSYESELFDVDDQQESPEDFRVTQMSSVDFPFGTPPIWQFEAEALAPDGTHDIETIVGSAPFAIHAHDFFPVMPPPDGLAGAYATVAAFQATGVTQASGVKWPRATGERNGRSFRYSCTVPKVIRDVVNFCPTAPDAYYRLPFAAGLTWTQGQGNLGTGSHKGLYAYDMNKSCGSDIRAMRAGRVILANSGLDCQNAPNRANCSSDLDAPQCGVLCCDVSTCGTAEPDPCEGNRVRIRHQDGTIGSYLHLEPDGTLVAVGEVVRRGQRIGRMGNTGRANGVHLHTGARIADASATMLILFEAVDPADQGNTLTCYEPKSGDTLLSNNVPAD